MLSWLATLGGKILTVLILFLIFSEFLTVNVYFFRMAFENSLSCLRVERMGELPDKMRDAQLDLNFRLTAHVFSTSMSLVSHRIYLC